MRILRSSPRSAKGPRCTLSIGTFDGAHIGHQKILQSLVRTARRKKSRSVVLTFADPPQKILRPQRFMPLLMSLKMKMDFLEKLGVDECLLVEFNRRFFSQTPRTFVKEYLLGRLRVGHLVLGYNFCFGRNRSGNVKLLRTLSKKWGFGLTVVPGVRRSGKIVSSTRIRGLIGQGRLAEAARLLGRPYTLEGRVIRGSHRGRRLGYPTANLSLDRMEAPPVGVYAARISTGRSQRSGMVNVGWRPTFVSRAERPKQPTVEAHIFDHKRSLYGRRVQVQFLRRIRGERRFSSSHALSAQLRHDEAFARRICSN